MERLLQIPPSLFVGMSDQDKAKLFQTRYLEGRMVDWSNPEVLQASDLYYQRSGVENLISHISESLDDDDFLLTMPTKNISTAHSQITRELALETEDDQGAVEFSNNVVCRRCGNKKVLFEIRKTRSSDEPLTIFFRCAVCGNTWKG